MSLIDTHCHLNDSTKFPNVAEEIEDAVKAGAHLMIVVGVNPEEWEFTAELANRHPELNCILGWHPNYTANYSETQLGLLRQLLMDPKCLGLGEIGLDYHWDYAPKELQFRALKDQLDLAEELDKPVIFHAREAYADLLTVLEARPPRPYLLHCFAGNSEEAARAVKLGCYFGVDGPITYPKSDELRSIFAQLPPDRIVLETDAPYMSPVPFRGKQNRPAYIPFINKKLAETLNITEIECAKQTSENALRFFNWNS